MKKYLNFRSLTAIVMSVSILFAVSSCDKEPVDERPELPPVESMMMDFSDFTEPAGGTKGTLNTYENFTYSYITVGVMNFAAAIVSVLPVTAYTVALQQSPVYVGDHTWEWSFDFPVNHPNGTVNYTATLTGARINNQEFSMEMVIALAAAPQAGVKWFDGVVRYDHTHATWTIYRDGTTSVLEIEWNNDFETQEADLTYTLTDPDHVENGSYISAAYMPDEFFDAAYTISLVAGMTNIEWNTTTIEGRVKAPVQFGDNEWHCWDTKANGLMDKVCD
jgi:hypothetical protein